MPKNNTTSLKLVTVAGVETSVTTSATIAVNPDEFTVVLQVQQADDAIHLQLDDDAAHRLGIALVEAARQLTTYGNDD